MYLTWRPVWKFNFRVSEKSNPPNDQLCFLSWTKVALQLRRILFLPWLPGVKFHAQLRLPPITCVSEKCTLLVIGWFLTQVITGSWLFFYSYCPWMYITWNPLYGIYFWTLSFGHTIGDLFFFNIRKCKKAKGKVKMTLNFIDQGIICF